jgi:hypothetical protein
VAMVRSIFQWNCGGGGNVGSLAHARAACDFLTGVACLSAFQPPHNPCSRTPRTV